MAFEKGWKGGPGRPKGSVSLKTKLKSMAQYCNEQGFHPGKVLVEIAEDTKQPADTRIAATQLILEYGLSKPKPVDEDESDATEGADYDADALESAAEDTH
jgi:hypothetical protein